MIGSYIQAFFIKGCFLTHAQLGRKDYQTFWGNFLESKGIRVNKDIFRVLFFWVLPVIVFALSVLWQIVLKIPPLVKVLY